MRTIIIGSVLGLAFGCATIASAFDEELSRAYQARISGTPHALVPVQRKDGVLPTQQSTDGEALCAYCHTPPVDQQTGEPLWNRDPAAMNFSAYDDSALEGLADESSRHSLRCLACHDGMLGPDQVMNVIGYSRTPPPQMPGQNAAFLDAWPQGADAVHADEATSGKPCTACHRAERSPVEAAFFALATEPTSVTDGNERRDHPVGVSYPDAMAGTEFRAPTGRNERMLFFDDNGNGVADTTEVRLFRSAEGYNIECGSCHDTHGVPYPNGDGEQQPSFVRVDLAERKTCDVCHIK